MAKDKKSNNVTRYDRVGGKLLANGVPIKEVPEEELKTYLILLKVVDSRVVESEKLEVNSRDLKSLQLEEDVVGFYFYDISELRYKKRDYRSDIENKSCIYYFGEYLSASQASIRLNLSIGDCFGMEPSCGYSVQVGPSVQLDTAGICVEISSDNHIILNRSMQQVWPSIE